jgi:RNA polymerase sigma-70 factor (sigma-E family)
VEDFEGYVSTAWPRLLRSAWLLTHDWYLAEDLLQTTLAKVYGAWPKVRAADQPLAYARRVLVNAHLSWRRRLSNTEQVLESLPDRGSGDPQDRHAEADELRRVLLQLTPRVRAAVVLRYFDDLSEADTAAVMGCSRSTVNNHVTRGLAVLRSLLAADPESDATALAPTSSPTDWRRQ